MSFVRLIIFYIFHIPFHNEIYFLIIQTPVYFCSWNIKILVPIALPGLCSLHSFKSINYFEKPEYPFISLQFPRHISQSLLYLFFHWLLQFLKCAFFAQFPTTCGSPFRVRMLSMSLSSVRVLQSLSHTCMQTLLLISISFYYALYLFQRNF